MKRMQGFSLVELMVSMVLGLLITGAALQLLLANQQSFALQQTLSRVQENGQLFVRFLVTDLRRAGLEMANVASTDAQGVRFTASGNIPGSNNGNDYDRLTLSYHGVTDCEGSIAPAMTEVVNTYFVNDDSELLCQGGLTGGNGVVLLEDVEAFEVLYGIDEERDGTAKVNRYVEAGLQGGNPVLAVRFSLLLKEESNSLPKGDGDKEFFILTKTVKEPADSSVRRVFMSTVKMRNYNWDEV
ncbi:MULTISPECIES: PilW family protein [unclassified Alcanivorax]|jgi:type IV pilus assembly protein PilW|uniref:PilW family protein n=1 Tax=unclassified Alcanivorax TaxID=2638842 RepID=UPI00089FDC58|nr:MULTISPECIES: PilW family protein [unclassified Alcanivorax]MED5239526.1 PilW family protein [Pseudomonadota bacterium]MBB10256.1 prepilin-type cleavage/methylation domain-containing protein [Alcanivorax sp.]MBU86194.1 prepilin-type cleavage/methylation domain-containing protein [Alcanivorax sp.]MEE3389115.1 PilW family protein [Pseudomonadota bacterium]SEG21031.1 type IV pilus assembly protein PilW [Alcanivorax sp. DSM 26293]